MSDASDEELLRRARNNDTAAFEELVGRSRDRVFGVALRILHSEAEAAEVAQETFLSAWRSLGQLSGDQFSHWVHRIAANRALMRLRHQKVANQVEESIESPKFNARGSLIESVADWAPTAEGASLDAELRRAIEEASQSLPESARQVFLLHDVEGLDYQQISEITKDSVAALKSRLHRARLAMRAAIDRFYAEKGSEP
ncbi:MAG: sigma-70 family RNA polymerase sigma factor [Archangiaceae bacterium]|nr:sigma-70 family RNA polymerase sigma factor [Archangiaceae bacterium]